METHKQFVLDAIKKLPQVSLRPAEAFRADSAKSLVRVAQREKSGRTIRAKNRTSAHRSSSLKRGNN